MRIILFGAGQNLLDFLRKYEQLFKIMAIVDNDYSKWGKIIHERNEYKVMPPEILLECKDYDKIVVTTHYYEIRSQLIYYMVPEKSISDLKSFYNEHIINFESIKKYSKHIIISSHRKIKKNKNGSINQPMYVITPPFPEGFRHQGLGQMESHILSHCIYAREKEWIPVVDMKNYSCMYQKTNELGNVNTWENYYKQPMSYSLNDLSKAKKIIYSVESPWIQDNYKDNMEKKKAFYSSYIFVREELKKEINEEWQCLTGGKEKILGCVCRGTDIIGLNWKNNYPQVNEIISYLKEIKDDYEKIYLATEDQNIYERMLNQFGNDIIAYNQQRYTVKKDKYLFEYEDTRQNARYLRGKDYLFVLEMLSRCVAVTGMIGTAASIASMKNPKLKIIPVHK